LDRKLLELNIRRLQSGEINALDEIYKITSRSVYVLSFSILKDKERAEDIVQDTYVKIIKNIHTYAPDTSAIAWIATIARNLSYNEYSRTKRNVSIELFEDNLEDNKDPLEQLVNTIYLKNAVKHLDTDEREVLILSAFNSLKHREIAEIVDKPIGTVHWLFDKAKKKLKKIMQNQTEPSDNAFKEKQKENGIDSPGFIKKKGGVKK